MSGLTPLLDTLLHDVLGRRIEPQARPAGPGIILPITPTAAPPALPADTRLETRPAPLAPKAEDVQSGVERSPRQPAGTPSPAHIRLSATAQLIASLLSRASSTPPTVQPAQALLPGPAPEPELVSTRLQGSIQESGLFYESHLEGWYRGRVSTSQLSREPQMRGVQLPVPTPSPAASGSDPRTAAPAPLLGFGPRPSAGPQPLLILPASAATAETGSSFPSPAPLVSGNPGANGLAAPLVHGTGQPLPPAAAQPASYLALVDAPPLTSSPHAETGVAARPDRASEREGNLLLQASAVARELTEPLQELVQRQLQVLAAPVLRWEGDIWSGLFMSLLIQPSQERGERARDGEAREGQDEQGEGWQSQFTIVAGALGSLRVQLWLRGDELDLQLQGATPEALARLQEGRESLLRRLQACGFPEPRLSLGLARPEVADA